MCFANTTLAQVPQWTWAQGISAAGGTSAGTGLALDRWGNQTLVGAFQPTALLGMEQLNGRGGADVLLAQYTAVGQLRWARQAGGMGEDEATAVVSDQAGNLYVTGYFQVQAFFEGLGITSAGSSDLFLAKYSASGQLLWLRGVGGVGTDAGAAVALDSLNNVVVAGSFQAQVTAGSTTLVSSSTAAGMVLKYDSQGNLLWARSLDNSRISGIATGLRGDVYLTGSITASNSILAKYSASGALKWVHPSAYRPTTSATAIATDRAGKIYITGGFRDTLAIGSARLVSQGGCDGFLAQFDQLGSTQWARNLGGPGDDMGRGLALNRMGQIALTGYFHGPATVGSTSLPGTSGCSCSEIFATGFDNTGNALWAKALSSSDASQGNAVVIDSLGSIGLTGTYRGSAEFDGATLMRGSNVNEAFTSHLTNTFPDLTVSTAQAVQGSYRNVTITGTGTATLAGPLQVTGTFTVKAGGQLLTGGFVGGGPGRFALADGATLATGHPAGLAATPGTSPRFHLNFSRH